MILSDDECDILLITIQKIHTHSSMLLQWKFEPCSQDIIEECKEIWNNSGIRYISSS